MPEKNDKDSEVDVTTQEGKQAKVEPITGLQSTIGKDLQNVVEDKPKEDKRWESGSSERMRWKTILY